MEIFDLVYDIEWGILIHQLPNELIGKVTEVLPRGIKHTFSDESGLHVYLSSGSKCNEFIRKKYIVLDGITFNIYSTVTCLTVFDIYSSSSTEEDIKCQVEAKGMRVFDLYRITHTDNYRIILDVPEVLANFQLSPISLDSDGRTIYPMAFFCRLCRKEGHKQYQCRQPIKEEADDTGNRSVGTSSNNARSSRQEIDIKPFVSDVCNTGVGTTGNQSFGNLSARLDLPASHPSTSRMETAAEAYLQARQSLKTGSNIGASNIGVGTTGTQSFGNSLARVNLNSAYPSTSRMATAAESLTKACHNFKTNNVFQTPIKPLKKPVTNTQSSSKQKYPCNEIVKIMNKVHGILPPKTFHKFLEVVYHKQMVFKYASEFTNDIPRLIEQIRSVISQFYLQSYGSEIAKKHIRLLEDLCRRLEDSWMSSDY